MLQNPVNDNSAHHSEIHRLEKFQDDATEIGYSKFETQLNTNLEKRSSKELITHAGKLFHASIALIVKKIFPGI